MDDFALPFKIRSYTLIEEIGHGGFSKVYKATSSNFVNQIFVAKILNLNHNKSEEARERVFEAETEALRGLNHPNIIRLYDSFVQDNFFVMILEYCPNGSLEDEVKLKKGLSLDKFTYYAKQITSALSYCHSRNIAHHDIKIQNILIDRYGRPKLADFGLSLKMEEDESSESFNGSISYVAPEILSKVAFNPFKADIWALGVTFIFMITGSSPWPSKDINVVKKFIMAGTYHLQKKIPQQVSDMIKRMIVVDPANRINIQDLCECKLLKNKEILTQSSLSKISADVLSPRGRRLSASGSLTNRLLLDDVSAARFAVSNEPNCPKAVEIYRANVLAGLSNLKKIKPRLVMPSIQKVLV